MYKKCPDISKQNKYLVASNLSNVSIFIGALEAKARLH